MILLLLALGLLGEIGHHNFVAVEKNFLDWKNLVPVALPLPCRFLPSSCRTVVGRIVKYYYYYVLVVAAVLELLEEEEERMIELCAVEVLGMDEDY